MPQGTCITILFVLAIAATVTLVLMMAGMSDDKAALVFAASAFIGMATAIALDH